MSTIHVGYANLRNEAMVVLLYVFVSIFCTTTSNCNSFVGGCIMFDYLSFLSLTHLQKEKICLAQSSSKNLFITHILSKTLHFLIILVEICSYLLHKIYRSQIFVGGSTLFHLPTFPSWTPFQISALLYGIEVWKNYKDLDQVLSTQSCNFMVTHVLCDDYEWLGI